MSLFVAVVSAAVASSPGDGAIREATRDVLSDAGYQTTLGGDRPARSVSGGSGPEPHLSTPSPALSVLGRILWWLLIGAAAAALIAVGVWVALRAKEHRPDVRVPEEADPAAPSGPVGLADGPDPWELARLGRFGEAIHALLRRAFGGLGEVVEDSATAREVLARVHLPEPRRAALRELVLAVELCHFGGRPAGTADWERCRGAFQTVTGAS